MRAASSSSARYRPDGGCAGLLIAARHSGLSSAFFSRRQATILVVLGIANAHSLKTYGVHAARSSAVPSARLDVEKDTSPSTRPNINVQLIVGTLFTRQPNSMRSSSNAIRFPGDAQGRLRGAAARCVNTIGLYSNKIAGRWGRDSKPGTPCKTATSSVAAAPALQAATRLPSQQRL